MKPVSAIAIVLAAFLGLSVGAGVGSSGDSGQAPLGAAAASGEGCTVFTLAPDGRFASEFAKIDEYLNRQVAGRLDTDGDKEGSG